jgi:hypothetical protein
VGWPLPIALYWMYLHQFGKITGQREVLIYKTMDNEQLLIIHCQLSIIRFHLLDCSC